MISPHFLVLLSLSLHGSSEPSTQEIADYTLEELLNTTIATGRSQSPEEAPSIVSVVTDHQIQNAGYRTVGEALRSIVGVAIVDDHVNLNMGVRGFYSSVDSGSDIIKIMINGQPIPFRPTSANMLGFDLLPIQAVRQIEVIRGPASARYGANAYLGIVNVITYQGAEIKEQGGLHSLISVDTFYLANPEKGTINGSIAARTGGKLGPVELLISGAYARTDRSGLVLPGADDIRSDNPKGYPSPGWTSERRPALLQDSISRDDISEEASLYALGTFDLGESRALRLDASLQYNNKHGEWLTDSYLSHKTQVSLLNTYLRIVHEATPAAGGFGWKVSLALHHATPTGSDRLFDTETPFQLRVRDFAATGVNVFAEANYVFDGGSAATLGFDSEYTRHNLLTMRITDTRTGAIVSEDGYGDRDFLNVAGYAQLIWILTPELQLTAGGRLDANTVIACNSDDWNCFGSQTTKITPTKSGRWEGEVAKGGLLQMSNRLAGVLASKDWPVYVKTIYASSYKLPTPFQLYHEQTTTRGTRGQPNLKPQTADSLEFLLGAKPLDNVHVTATVFYLTLRQLVGTLPGASALEYRNLDGRSLGLELTTNARWGEIDLSANASYLLSATVRPLKRPDESALTWQTSALNTTIDAGGYPRLLANFSGSWTIPDSYLHAGIAVHYVGSRPASIAHNKLSSLDLSDAYDLSDYWLFSAHLSTRGLYLVDDLESRFRIQASIPSRNYEESGYGGVDIPGLAGSVLLSVTQEL